MALGVFLLLCGARFSRVSSLLTAWLCLGVLTYYVMAVEGKDSAESLPVAFLLPLLLAAAVAWLRPLARFLLGALVAFICWLGFHTLFPDALRSSPAGLYVLLAVPAALFGAAAVLAAPVAFIAGTPVVGVFLVYQGVTTFLHEPWPVLQALYAEEGDGTCGDARTCYIAFAVALVAAATGVALQSVQAARAVGDAEPTAPPSSDKYAIPMVALRSPTPAAAACASTDSTVVPLHTADATEPVSVDRAHVVLLPPSPDSREAQHIVVEDAPTLMLVAYPTAPVAFPPLRHPAPESHVPPLPVLGVGTAVAGQRWGTEPVGIRDRRPGNAADEDEELRMPDTEEVRRWGSHVSVGSKAPQTPHTLWRFDYEQPDEVRPPFSAQPHSAGDARTQSSSDSGQRTSVLAVLTQEMAAEDDIGNVSGSTGGPRRPMYHTLTPQRASSMSYNATLSSYAEPVQLVVHEAERSANDGEESDRSDVTKTSAYR